MTVCSLTGTYTYDPNVTVLWETQIADVQIPTSSEIVTGTNLTTTYCLTDIVGWEIETEMLTGKWGPFQEQRMGKQKIQDSRLMFAADRAGNDVRALWNRGSEGYIVILPSGPYANYPSAPVNVYPVRVAQITQQQRLHTGQGSLIIVSFAVRARCGENVTVAP